ncbi:Protein CBG27491 [Caenorhabditis briggsae]|uniref:Protein CBG27491 n=1 Tax=Caenorhabditis briggsae TaxID=6238 RepID=B6IF06_CAEBR|nr:Protein CBG27491 [Caenorhabditis briggsae]CAR98486.1 Protein CBG27491 [Caenorhabditis briggsae]
MVQDKLRKLEGREGCFPLHSRVCESHRNNVNDELGREKKEKKIEIERKHDDELNGHRLELSAENGVVPVVINKQWLDSEISFHFEKKFSFPTRTYTFFHLIHHIIVLSLSAIIFKKI